MNSVVQKTKLRDGYYYSGYALQHYCVVATEQPKIVGMWDSTENCFWFWEFDNNRKIKRSLKYLNDIDNEIEEGFFPLKEIIPKEEFLLT